MPLRGLRTRIFFNMAAILICAMVLIDLVILVTVQKWLIQSEGERSRLALTFIQQALVRAQGIPDDSSTAALQGVFLNAVRSADASCGVYSNKGENAVFRFDRACRSTELLIAMAHEAASTGKSGKRFEGTAWAVFWQAPRDLVIYAPVETVGRATGGIALSFDLDSVYAPLRTSQKIFFIYIILNTLIFSALGFYRISRLYLEPLHRMARRAEGYREDSGMPFAVRKEDNELRGLSHALNQMIRRIAEDKKTLKDTVYSLKAANTELRQAQADVIRAEKLSTVGRLASGVAHEIGNPIGIVLGYLELLKASDTTAAERQDYIARSEDEIQRISSIIHQLLDFSRPAAGVPAAVSAHAVIDEVVDMLKVQPILCSIEFCLRLGAAQDTVFADLNQIKQILINIILNAADAIAAKGDVAGGRVVLSSELTATGHESCNSREVQQGAPLLTIRCADNGSGIPGDQISYVFDPFFTTKGPKKGTGLGLSVSYMIAEGMGGRLEVESTPGDGTTFSLHLPLHSGCGASSAGGGTG